MSSFEEYSRGEEALRPRARILHTFGDELISSENVAVIELVKNAYDADATKVWVCFENLHDKERSSLKIIDNGNGMDVESILNVWLQPATPNRKRDRQSKIFKRRVLGEKGIGRFAATKLGKSLEVISRKKLENGVSEKEISIYFDWKQFDDPNKFLDEIKIPWEEKKASNNFCYSCSESLWLDNNDDKLYLHGTILNINNLNIEWKKSHLQSLYTSLSRLISPFGVFQREFQIYLLCPPPFENQSARVDSLEMLKSPHYKITGNIDAIGNYNLFLSIHGDEKQKCGIFRLQDKYPPMCGPFDIELRVWDRDRKDLEDIALKHSLTYRQVREDLNNVAGISLYRDGFRVLPYGERDNDWLRLDQRRFLNPTKHISNNQMVGYVLITGDENPNLYDQSNREGIVEGEGAEDLRTLVKHVLNLLEIERYSFRHPDIKKEQKKTKFGLFEKFNLSDVRNMIQEKFPYEKEIQNALVEKEQELESQTKEVKNILVRYRRLAVFGQLIDIVLHEGRHPIAKIGQASHLGLKDTDSSILKLDELKSKIKKRFELINNQAESLDKLFKKLIPFGGRGKGRPHKVVLEDCIKDAFSLCESEIRLINVKVSLPNTQTIVTVDPTEIQQLMILFIDNSLHWLKEINIENREIQVTVKRKSENEVDIDFSDSGPGVVLEYQDKIFDVYFSTKPDGVGLGLSIAGEIVSDYYDGTLVLIDDGNLSGANFRITLRRRV